ncbi:MAG TPA: hypothetical protein VEI97_12455 [bacterium]|nr:hypothetical protein [bacterium]
MPTPIPVWTDPTGTTRYAALDFGTFFHRGPGVAVPVLLWNSLGQPTWPTMAGLALHAEALNPLTAQAVGADGLLVYAGMWQSLQEPVELGNLAPNTAKSLWLRLSLPTELASALPMGRLRAHLVVSWR